jgi:hypothetical protein
MKLLRRHKGDVAKVYNKLADKAKSMYPKTDDGRARSKAAAQQLLRWHISRIKFDFVKATGQHESSQNRANGSKKSSTTATKAKPAGKRGGRQKTAQSRTKASTSTAKKTTARSGAKKTAASRKKR